MKPERKAENFHPRIHALDELALVTRTDSEEDVIAPLIEFLINIGEVTVAAAARRALERVYGE